MEGKYAVYLGQTQVGTAEITQAGLYLQICCSCGKLEEISRLQVSCGEKKENLGILVPSQGGFGLKTRIPAKRLGEGEPDFRVIPTKPNLQGKFIPICPEEPFAYIERLKDAFLIQQEGQVGALIPEEN